MVARQTHLPTSGQRRRGFTLIELLIVVGIITILSALALAAVLHARTTALVIRTHSDLALIATALDAYKNDFGDYPRFPDPATTQAGKSITGSGYWLDTAVDRGARLLCRSLLGPGAAGVQLTGGALAPPNAGDDGADGPGFRVARNLVGTQLAGKVYGPYVQPDKFKLEFDPTITAESTTASPMSDAKLLDLNGHPILYFPATPGVGRASLPKGFVSSADPSTFTAPTSAAGNSYPVYNAYDNSADTTPPLSPLGTNRVLLDVAQMQYILGDRNTDGTIGTGETAVTSLPYLLWTAGADGVFGFGTDGNGTAIPPAVGLKSDDVCNFDLPADIRK